MDRYVRPTSRKGHGLFSQRVSPDFGVGGVTRQFQVIEDEASVSREHSQCGGGLEARAGAADGEAAPKKLSGDPDPLIERSLSVSTN